MHSCELSAEMLRQREKRLASLEFEEFLEPLGFKRCPGCGEACEKSDPDACDHMTCVACRKEFCWTCMADRTAILHHGNHYHGRECRFYAEYTCTDAVKYIDACPLCRRSGRPCRPPLPADAVPLPRVSELLAAFGVRDGATSENWAQARRGAVPQARQAAAEGHEAPTVGGALPEPDFCSGICSTLASPFAACRRVSRAGA